MWAYVPIYCSNIPEHPLQSWGCPRAAEGLSPHPSSQLGNASSCRTHLFELNLSIREKKPSCSSSISVWSCKSCHADISVKATFLFMSAEGLNATRREHALLRYRNIARCFLPWGTCHQQEEPRPKTGWLRGSSEILLIIQKKKKKRPKKVSELLLHSVL